MKQILILTITLFLNSLFAQSQATINYGYSYIYNAGKDTLHFSKILPDGLCLSASTIIKDSIQIDGIGSKEVIFFRNGNCSINEHGGTFDIDENTSVSKFEIWNLDSKKLLFEVITSYQSEFNKFNAYMQPSHLQGYVKFSCNFAIESNGDIKISNGKKDTKVNEVNWKTVTTNEKEEIVIEEKPYPYYDSPGKTEGIYKFVNGAYVLE